MRALLARRLLGYELRSVSRLGEGLDNAAYEINGELVVRVSKEPDPAARREATRHEASLLTAVAKLSEGRQGYRGVPGGNFERFVRPHGGDGSALYSADNVRSELACPRGGFRGAQESVDALAARVAPVRSEASFVPQWPSPPRPLTRVYWIVKQAEEGERACAKRWLTGPWRSCW